MKLKQLLLLLMLLTGVLSTSLHAMSSNLTCTDMVMAKSGGDKEGEKGRTANESVNNDTPGPVIFNKNDT